MRQINKHQEQDEVLPKTSYSPGSIGLFISIITSEMVKIKTKHFIFALRVKTPAKFAIRLTNRGH